MSHIQCYMQSLYSSPLPGSLVVWPWPAEALSPQLQIRSLFLKCTVILNCHKVLIREWLSSLSVLCIKEVMICYFCITMPSFGHSALPVPPSMASWSPHPREGVSGMTDTSGPGKPGQAQKNSKA